MLRQEQIKLKEKVRQLPQGPGVYLMKDRFGTTLYVGKAINLRKRVSSYFQQSRRSRIEQPKVRTMIPLIRDIEVIEVRTETEALLLEGRLIKERKPKYNTDFTDDKRFLLVKVDVQSPLPRFRLTRNRLDDGARYFGPFAHSGQLRQTLAEMRRRFGILLGDVHPQQIDGERYRLYDDVRAEIYGHPNEVTLESYRRCVEEAMDFLSGKCRESLEELNRRMGEAAAARNYEKAAELRDIIRALEMTISPDRRFTRPTLTGINSSDGVAELKDVLSLERGPCTIECFDISHISGTFCVASMVRFQDGKPDKKNYRHFRIQSFTGNDDFRAMCEVVGRRYRRLVAEKSPLPDLIVIDGGQGQVNAAMKAFTGEGITPPPLIGLAKREETIVFADKRPSVNLPENHPALKLLQRIRDEAHRFANSFNADLRSKRLRESILDDFPGLGPKRRQLLIAHFGSIAKLRRATPAELASVPGIGPATADALHQFLAERSRQQRKAKELFG